MITLSIRSKIFVSKWRIEQIVPLFKGQGLDPNSLSLVSLLSVTSKLVERAVQLQLVKYMERSKQLNPLSNSYRKHHGTTTTLI